MVSGEEGKTLRRFDQATTQRTTTSHPLSATTTTRPLGQSAARRRGRMVPIIIVISALVISALLVFVSTGLNFLPASFFHSGTHATTASAAVGTQKIVGHVYFMSSGQIHQDTSQGIVDQVQINLTNIPSPAAGKALYAWLLSGDAVEGQSVLLGKLAVQHGIVNLRYTGDQQHTDLLDFANRFLITEEDAGITPSIPPLDKSTWRFSAQFPQTPDPLDSVHHFSQLNHLRHLLSTDPTLKKLGLPGGLDIWLFRNTQKILEWAGGARDDWSRQGAGLMHRDIIRILDYLDGLNFVQNDVPPGTPVLTNPQIARAGLLEINANQEPPGLLYHVGVHLQGIVQSPGSSSEQHRLANQINTAINKVQALLEQVHKDARQLVTFSDAQLLQPPALALLDNMVKNAQDAFMGQFDPATGEIQDGITQIHFAVARLATMNVTVAA